MTDRTSGYAVNLVLDEEIYHWHDRQEEPRWIVRVRLWRPRMPYTHIADVHSLIRVRKLATKDRLWKQLAYLRLLEAV